MKILAIGDVHTKKWIIDAAEEVVDQYDRIVFCGDYADDYGVPAIESIDTWYRLKEFCSAYPEKIKPVRGNHDYIYTVKTPTKQSGFNATTQMLINLPEHAELKDWLTSLPLVIEIEGVTYAHAGIDQSWNGKYDVYSIWEDNSPIWVRPMWANYKKIPQVVGHTPMETCTEVQPNIWLIDTFSTTAVGEPIGDQTVLEIVDGKNFNVRKLLADDNDNSTNSI